VLARRLTTVAGPDGSTVASIDTDWAMVMDDGMSTRIPDEFRALLGARSTPFRPHRVSLPPSPDGAAAAADRPGPVRLAFRVRPQELDPMAHANNAAYVDWLEEALATDARSGIAGEHGATAPANGAEADRRPVDPGGLSDLLRQVPRTYRLEYLLPARPNVELTAEAWRSGGSAAAAYRLSDPAGDLLHATVEA
jgi:acyl-CoA thioesterase FadM